MKDNIGILIESCKQMAKELLIEFGEFYPFAFALDKKHEIIPVAAYEGEEVLSVEKEITLLEKALRHSDRNLTYTTVIICVDVFTPNSNEKSSALELRVDDKFYKSFNVYIRYEQSDNGEIKFEEISDEVLGNLIYFPR
ncbi:MAG: hypothetical protein V4538_03130 [Bacteroidota bacterium]